MSRDDPIAYCVCGKPEIDPSVDEFQVCKNCGKRITNETPEVREFRKGQEPTTDQVEPVTDRQDGAPRIVGAGMDLSELRERLQSLLQDFVTSNTVGVPQTPAERASMFAGMANILFGAMFDRILDAADVFTDAKIRQLRRDLAAAGVAGRGGKRRRIVPS